MHLALLRGVNLGPKHKLPMAALVDMFEALGCVDVATRGNSGNVLFRAPAALLPRVPGQLAAMIEAQFGFSTPVLLRSAGALALVRANNPFVDEGCDLATLHVAFLEREPDPERVAALDPNRSPPDRFCVRGREVYLHCPNGLARTKLSNAWFDAKLDTISTVRTWKLVGELLGLLQR